MKPVRIVKNHRHKPVTYRGKWMRYVIVDWGHTDFNYAYLDIYSRGLDRFISRIRAGEKAHGLSGVVVAMGSVKFK